MQALNGGYSPGAYPMLQSNSAFLNDFATQMAISEASRRLSRQPNNQRSGSAMRISKPSSANNSPRAPLVSNRRRTMASAGQPSPPLQQHIDYLSMPVNEPIKRSCRPVSWHPSSHLYTPQAYFQQQQVGYPTPMSTIHPEYQQDIYSGFPQLSPMMAAYSATNSPCSNFSPLPAGYPSGPNYLTPDGWDCPQGQTHYFPSMPSSQPLTQASPPSGYLNQEAQANNAAWTTYGHGISSTSPPTPDSFIQPQQQPQVSEEAMSYQDLDEPEEEGEILVGMGLYDTPDKLEDPHLNNYRSTVSSLLGPAYRPHESMGKGLKLEETWEPPQSDDEDDVEDDESDDSEAPDESSTTNA